MNGVRFGEGVGIVSKKLFVGGISWNTSEEGLRSAFERFGASHDLEVLTASGVLYAIADGSILRRLKGESELTVWLPRPSWTLRWLRRPVRFIRASHTLTQSRDWHGTLILNDDHNGRWA